MKNESRIEELLSDLLRSSDKTKEEMSKFRQETNNNFIHLDTNFKMIVKQFELMNEKFDKVIDVNEKN